MFVIVLPFLGVLVYLIAQHDGMRDRALKQARTERAAIDQYVRETAGGPASEIAKAKQLQDTGAINQAEFDASSRGRSRRQSDARFGRKAAEIGDELLGPSISGDVGPTACRSSPAFANTSPLRRRASRARSTDPPRSTLRGRRSWNARGENPPRTRDSSPRAATRRQKMRTPRNREIVRPRAGSVRS